MLQLKTKNCHGCSLALTMIGASLGFNNNIHIIITWLGWVCLSPVKPPGVSNCLDILWKHWKLNNWKFKMMEPGCFYFFQLPGNKRFLKISCAHPKLTYRIFLFNLKGEFIWSDFFDLLTTLLTIICVSNLKPLITRQMSIGTKKKTGNDDSDSSLPLTSTLTLYRYSSNQTWGTAHRP